MHWETEGEISDELLEEKTDFKPAIMVTVAPPTGCDSLPVRPAAVKALHPIMLINLFRKTAG